MGKHRLVSALVVLALSIGSAQGLAMATDALPDEQWTLATDQSNSGQELLGFRVQENVDLPYSKMTGSDESNPGLPEQSKARLCTSARGAFCGVGASNFQSVLAPCQSAEETNCLESISAISESGTVINGRRKGSIPIAGYTDFQADQQWNVPAGAAPSTWIIPGVTHGGASDEYLVSAQVRGGRSAASAKYGISSYSISISPVTEVKGDYSRPKSTDSTSRLIKYPECETRHTPCGIALDGWQYPKCASVDDGLCALRQKFPEGYRFKISIRLAQSPTGWFHGRMSRPDISIKQVGSGVLISFEAQPVVVPVIGVLQPRSGLSQEILSYYADTNRRSSGSASGWGNPGPNNFINVLVQPDSDAQDAFDQFALWSTVIKNTASASPTMWTVRTLNVPQETNSCLSNPNILSGIVTTNSMAYSPGPPTYSKDSGTLDYKVASPHLTSAGQVFEGTYDLQIRSEVARCVYGFTDAPVAASVSIINDSGESRVTSTTVTEKDGWFKLGAYGFTFSSPTLKVKLTQPKLPPAVVPTPVAPTPVAAPTPVVAKPLIKSITCTKGKTKVVVKGASPKCPTGYKKVA
ncbi:MAG: hypothetical protein WCI25_06055 [Actinomycetes bacterium]